MPLSSATESVEGIKRCCCRRYVCMSLVHRANTVSFSLVTIENPMLEVEPTGQRGSMTNETALTLDLENLGHHYLRNEHRYSCSYDTNRTS